MSGEADREGNAKAARRCLDLLAERTRDLIEERSADDPSASDPLRGLRLSQEHIGWLRQAGVGV